MRKYKIEVANAQHNLSEEAVRKLMSYFVVTVDQFERKLDSMAQNNDNLLAHNPTIHPPDPTVCHQFVTKDNKDILDIQYGFQYTNGSFRWMNLSDLTMGGLRLVVMYWHQKTAVSMPNFVYDQDNSTEIVNFVREQELLTILDHLQNIKGKATNENEGAKKKKSGQKKLQKKRSKSAYAWWQSDSNKPKNEDSKCILWSKLTREQRKVYEDLEAGPVGMSTCGDDDKEMQRNHNNNSNESSDDLFT